MLKFVLVACFWNLLIGLTRIYLGAHYLTDVIGALAAGLFWLVFCWTAFETLHWRRY
ncbi:MAG TPA: phosphatase PAP2 family protein [Candidatus Dormibacteraeota bacterium]|jgi:undecaprenyl-diphosphatase|nr:phosphatase PAP2 family protein [Candidatus Dormibacteraeota bacterium]